MAIWRGTIDLTEPRSAPLAIVALVRPRQWTKNVLVLAAPAAAGVLGVAALAHVAVAFVAFCLVASGTYCLNDAADVDRDRLHPVKRFRPVASGAVDVTTARLLGVSLLVAGVAVSALAGRWQLPAVTLAYVALTASYTTWLKHMAVIDLAAVAAGFVLRAVAGAAATGLPVSDWFLITAAFGSLLMVAGKRSCELQDAGDGEGDAAAHRAVLGQYPPNFLQTMRTVAVGMTLLSYTLFAFERTAFPGALPLYKLSIVPFGLAIFRYTLRVEQGSGGAPEELALTDRPLQVLGLLWVAIFLAAVYLT